MHFFILAIKNHHHSHTQASFREGEKIGKVKAVSRDPPMSFLGTDFQPKHSAAVIFVHRRYTDYWSMVPNFS